MSDFGIRVMPLFSKKKTHGNEEQSRKTLKIWGKTLKK
jgi:hypothetical protein